MNALRRFWFAIVMVLLLAGSAGGYYQFVWVANGDVSKHANDVASKIKMLDGLIAGKPRNQGDVDALLRYKSRLRGEISALIGQLEARRRSLVWAPDGTQNEVFDSEGEIDGQELRDLYKEHLDKWGGTPGKPGPFREAPDAGVNAPVSGAATGMPGTQAAIKGLGDEVADFTKLNSSYASMKQSELRDVLKRYNVREKILSDMNVMLLCPCSEKDKPAQQVVYLKSLEVAEGAAAGARQPSTADVSRIPFRFEVQCSVDQILPFLARLQNQNAEQPSEPQYRDMLIVLDAVSVKKLLRDHEETMLPQGVRHVMVSQDVLNEQPDPQAFVSGLLAELRESRANVSLRVAMTVDGAALDFSDAFLYPAWTASADGLQFTDPWTGDVMSAEEKQQWERKDRGQE